MAPASAAVAVAEAASAPEPAASVAAEAVPVQPTAASAVAPAPLVAAAPAPAARASTALSPRERRARETREREARSAGATAPVAPPATGQLMLAISPWGEIEVDGAPAGTSPPLNRLSLPEGPHTITVRNADFPPYTTTVKITADQPLTLKHRFGS
jgi:serine/threonine-protein kinase